MSEQRSIICDRCGKKIGTTYPKYKVTRKIAKFKTLAIFRPSHHDYIENDFDLCADCNKEFFDWLNYKWIGGADE